MEVSSTSSTKLTVTSLATKLAPSIPASSSCTVSATDSSTIFSTSSILVSSLVLITLALSTSTSILVSSVIDISISILPSVAPFLGNVSIFYLVSTPISIQSLCSIPFFIASPSISTIVYVPKVKLVIIEVEQRKPLKLLITGKEIEEDIDLDTTTVEEMRLAS